MKNKLLIIQIACSMISFLSAQERSLNDLQKTFCLALESGKVSEISNLLDENKQLLLHKFQIDFVEGSNRIYSGPNFGDALIYAIKKGYDEIAKILIFKGANVNTQDTFGKTALSYAITEKQEEIAILLLDQGADPNLKCSKYPWCISAWDEAQGTCFMKIIMTHQQ